MVSVAASESRWVWVLVLRGWCWCWGLSVGLAVGVGVGLSQPMLSATKTPSIRQPVPAPLQSVARRKRRRTFGSAAETGIWAKFVVYRLSYPSTLLGLRSD